jgi:hypothetical protein
MNMCSIEFPLEIDPVMPGMKTSRMMQPTVGNGLERTSNETDTATSQSAQNLWVNNKTDLLDALTAVDSADRSRVIGTRIAEPVIEVRRFEDALITTVWSKRLTTNENYVRSICVRIYLYCRILPAAAWPFDRCSQASNGYL